MVGDLTRNRQKNIITFTYKSFHLMRFNDGEDCGERADGGGDSWRVQAVG